MKKPYIYAAAIAALLIFGALAAVYQINHPGRIIPSKYYTEKKAEYLTANYRPTAEQMGIEDSKKGSTVYAAMIEVSTPELEKTGSVTAMFDFIDITGKRDSVLSDGTSVLPKEMTDEEIKQAFDSLAALFDDGYKAAENTDYGIPDYEYVKVYLRRGDGVYYKLYKEDALPEAVSDYLSGQKIRMDG
jgi:hypothetical protein